MKLKYLVAGAGITGLTIAERISNVIGDDVLVVERDGHIGGNCYDCYDDNGVLIHKYGPHIFHTNKKEVWDYLSGFTEWRLYQHRVLTFVDGQLLPMPICAETVNRLFGLDLSHNQIDAFLDTLREKDRVVKNSEDVVLKNAGREIYEKFFRHYTKKQWDMYPEALDPSVISRVPIRTNNDQRYFTDRYQGLPKRGYTEMLRRMTDNPRVHLLLNTDYRDVIRNVDYELLVCTAPIDAHYDYELGRLKYRSLDIRFETHTGDYQPAAVVNYPNDYDFTRITEYKKLTGQESPYTTLSFEYPVWEGRPYYPVPTAEQRALYEKYKALGTKEKNVIFAGRLGEYRYYNMDDAVASAHGIFRDRIQK
jgi:UDP-galactopyranose mutase